MPSTPSASKKQEQITKRAPTSKDKLGASGRIPRDDSDVEIKKLEAPELIEAVVKIQQGKLILKCSEVKGAKTYEWEVRRDPLNGLANSRTSDKPRTEMTRYPIGLPGIPQVRVRAVGDGALSLYTPWMGSTHDLGRTD